MTTCFALPTTNQPFHVSSPTPGETDYVDTTTKEPLRPEEPRTEGGKSFQAMIHLFCYVNSDTWLNRFEGLHFQYTYQSTHFSPCPLLGINLAIHMFLNVL